MTKLSEFSIDQLEAMLIEYKAMHKACKNIVKICREAKNIKAAIAYGSEGGRWNQQARVLKSHIQREKELKKKSSVRYGSDDDRVQVDFGGPSHRM